MYANIVRARYKSKKDADLAHEKLKPILGEVATVPGFQHFTWVKLADDETISVAVFATPEAAATARERMPPKAMALVGEHVVGQPDVRHGPVLATK